MADLITKQRLAAGVAIGAVLVLGYVATRAVGPVDVPHLFTEAEGPVQDFQAHLAHLSELLAEPVSVPHRYPDRTCPGTTQTMHQGFAPLYKIPDPQVAALPAQEPW